MADENGKGKEQDRSGWPAEALDVITRLEKRLGEVNSESAQRKEELREIRALQEQERDKVNQQRRAEKEAATNALKEQGKYRPLYEESQKRIADIEAELELVKQKNETYEGVLTQSVKARTDNLPEEYRGMVPAMSPDLQLAWLDSNSELLTRPTPERRNTSAQFNTNDSMPLTEMQEVARKAAGMTEEAYRERLKQINNSPVQ